MADSPDYGEPRRTIRISDELWQAVLATARERGRGETASAVARRAFESYVKRHNPQWNQQRRDA